MGVFKCSGCGAEVEFGHKCDSDKLRFDLIPPEAEYALARVLTYGAKKYAPRNWEAGMEWGRCYAAARRHLTAWWSGEDTDADTGFCHLDHAIACLAFLRTYKERGIGRDDRPAEPPGARRIGF